ncbi:membrane integrity-associated transporter subunit PqiC [Pseudochrobactrum algeriensis]|uniref:ABC-type transport auxiliary lipoprotein family protein n=1 Tax=Pseudochrobactrum algeriensis TaxID=2834768 RepID=UPI001BCDD624|nr:ABC-type transport auxiliary lipoprotein family protein [Pseudochrobactrum algeriensis]MBX8811504.1 ABC transporter [Ochrobactrum sp. MR34]QVQ37921.1 membrane integrity-associated transporter subunit PqiC [Pseudochrobactrum algeriensis]QVQ45067.1 membrane integrity-associated transporter subunit PqiC [Pseudochrobactrum algeriensis]
MLKHILNYKLTVLGAAVLLAGCTTTPLDTFSLSSSPQVQVSQKRKNVQILVPTPAALKALDSENIVIHDAPGSITYLKGAQWGDRLTNLVQARLVQAFENSNAVGGVGRPGDGLAINYQVQAELRDFGINASSSPQTAKIELAVRVLNDKTGEVRATRVFTSSVPVSGAGNKAYIRALDAGFSDVTRQIVAWVVSVI